MRYYNKRKNKYYCPIVNLDKLWALKGEEVRDATQANNTDGCHAFLNGPTPHVKEKCEGVHIRNLVKTFTLMVALTCMDEVRV